MFTKGNAIVVLNTRSSSMNFSLYDAGDVSMELMARGHVDGLGTSARFTATDKQGLVLADKDIQPTQGRFGHREAFAHLAQWLHEHYGREMVLAVGHRMIHGGSDFIEPSLLSAEVLERLEELVPLMPLDLPHNLAGVRAVSQVSPGLPQVACFDTAFHRNRAVVTERFGLPYGMFEHGVKRWGFYGLSYESILRQFKRLEPQLSSGRIIVAQLGRGASLCAVKGGRSVDTTTGFSMLDGLPAEARCGSLDPGVILYLLRQMTADQLQELLCNQSGLLGLSGISGELRVLLASHEPRAVEAVDYFVYHVIREIGSLMAVLGGLDALIFSAGMGEDLPPIRTRVCKGLAWLGAAIEPGANERCEKCLSVPGKTPSIWLLSPDEDGLIAAYTCELVSKLPNRIRYSRGGGHAAFGR